VCGLAGTIRSPCVQSFFTGRITHRVSKINNNQCTFSTSLNAVEEFVFNSLVTGETTEGLTVKFKGNDNINNFYQVGSYKYTISNEGILKFYDETYEGTNLDEACFGTCATKLTYIIFQEKLLNYLKINQNPNDGSCDNLLINSELVDTFSNPSDYMITFSKMYSISKSKETSYAIAKTDTSTNTWGGSIAFSVKAAAGVFIENYETSFTFSVSFIVGGDTDNFFTELG